MSPSRRMSRYRSRNNPKKGAPVCLIPFRNSFKGNQQGMELQTQQLALPFLPLMTNNQLPTQLQTRKVGKLVKMEAKKYRIQRLLIRINQKCSLHQ